MRLWKLALGLTASLGVLGATNPQPTTDQHSVENTVQEIYNPYTVETNSLQSADWERPIYSRKTGLLISTWRHHLGNEPIDALSVFGWLCDCQDWDSQHFKVTLVSLSFLKHDSALAEIRVNVGWGTVIGQRLTLVKEQGLWRVDDLISNSMPKGLKRALEDQLHHPPGN